jgi:hypothetical protein
MGNELMAQRVRVILFSMGRWNKKCPTTVGVSAQPCPGSRTLTCLTNAALAHRKFADFRKCRIYPICTSMHGTSLVATGDSVARPKDPRRGKKRPPQLLIPCSKSSLSRRYLYIAIFRERLLISISVRKREIKGSWLLSCLNRNWSSSTREEQRETDNV